MILLIDIKSVIRLSIKLTHLTLKFVSKIPYRLIPRPDCPNHGARRNQASGRIFGFFK